ncbi:hypothetical protein BDV35DRAFT_336766 [Aspergillus flavus]|uniref:Uncharacterized protein n=1 Tax=Aspergillus flavus TaxID=5059 RepID=A0A5N6HC35_ASPFL|nr:hypothetical protein BDV35DRAFT_336766 [Aspergillus flavus]
MHRFGVCGAVMTRWVQGHTLYDLYIILPAMCMICMYVYQPTYHGQSSTASALTSTIWYPELVF